ncbi:MAG: PKD domain-containing protein [archaeon]
MRKLIFFVVFSVILSSLVCGFSVSSNQSYSIKYVYAPGEIIQGWINISLQNDASNLQLDTSLDGDSIDLIDFVKKNSLNYDCLPKDCEDNYKVRDEATFKQADLAADSQKLYGFKISEPFERVDELRFNISSNTFDSCAMPLRIDLCNDGNINWKYKEFFPVFDCGVTDLNCYNSGATLNEYDLTASSLYCQEFQLTERPAYEISVDLIKGADTNVEFTLEIRDQGGSPTGKYCKYNGNSWTTKVNCTVINTDGSIGSGKYFACISVDSSTPTGKHKIKAETENPKCGYAGDFGGVYDADYPIQIKGARYDAFDNSFFSQVAWEEQNGGDLVDYINNYINGKYRKISGTSNYNCSSDCVIPIRFYGGLSQALRVSNIYLHYQAAAGGRDTNKIYDVDLEPAKLTSKYFEFDLSVANFTAPKSYGNHTLIITLGGTEILNEKVSVAKIPVIGDVYPNQVPAGRPVTLYVNVSSPADNEIVSYNWSFSDGVSQVTTEGQVTRTFSRILGYSLDLTVKDSTGQTAIKRFTIIAGDPEIAINSTIKDYRNRLENLRADLSFYTGWYKNIIEEKIGIDELEEQIRTQEIKFINSFNDPDKLVPIMSNLTELNIPIKLMNKNEGSMPLFIDPSQVNFDYLDSMGAGSAPMNSSGEDAYEKAISNWLGKYATIDYDFQIIALYFEDGSYEFLMGVFDLNIDISEAKDGKEMYLVISHDDIDLDKEYNIDEFDDATGIIFDSISNKNVGILVEEEIEPENLVAYLAPQFSELEIVGSIGPCNFNNKCEKSLGETWKNCRQDCKPVGWMIFWIFILMIGALAVYIILQEWYKRRYENYLFNNRNDLYNLVNFVKNAKNQGLGDGEITKRLKKSGWDGEQISYVFKKVKGKRVGMLFEIPIPKLFKRFPKKKYNPMAQNLPGNRRLINIGRY